MLYLPKEQQHKLVLTDQCLAIDTSFIVGLLEQAFEDFVVLGLKRF